MKKTIIINSSSMGSDDKELGEKLMGSFLRKIWGADNKPERILFYNSGVKLLVEGSPVLDALDGLSEAGVDLVACGTCVLYYDVKEKIAVGRVSNMQEIAATMLQSQAVLTI
ncbi:MAG: sulfurtransferase-like selenium metabolism protein YedF [Candidatus Zixiibacteriota bacterium]|nr:MAG: sulfurtransferase-like selenium metabolism protein YedF [candidate division Zixibacteria bacterium]